MADWKWRYFAILLLAALWACNYYREGYQQIRGDLQQLAATLNNPLKRWPGAYARAFLLPLSLEREH